MADVIARLKVESKEYEAKINRAKEGLLQLERTVRNAGESFLQTWKDEQAFAKGLGQMQTVSKSAAGQLSELKGAFVDLSMVYKRMTDEEKKSPFGKALSSSLSELKTRIDEAKGNLAEVTTELNGGGGGGLKGALDAVAGKFGLNIQQLAGWGAALGAAKVALDVSRDAFFQSESNIDEWGRTVEGAKGAYNTFLDTINSGNWSEFFSNMSTAVQGARDLYDALDRLGSIKSNNAAAIAIVQQQIAQLRLAKQQGENVDEQIKAATAKLAELQGQSVSAGKSAGTLSIGNIIRSAYDTQGTGGKISDRNINNVVNELLQDGQNAFDKYAKVYKRLEEKASDTRKVPVGTSITGASISATERYTNLDKLTEEERKQYTLSKAITEAETRIQKGISIYAQAVSEGTANAREEFKGNRYALSGSGGGKTGSGDGSVKPLNINLPKKSYVQDFSSYNNIENKWYDNLNSVNSGMLAELKAIQVANINRFAEVNEIPLAFELDESATQQQIQDALDNINMFMGENPIKINFSTGEIESAGKIAGKTWKEAASAVQSVGQAFNQIEDPAAKVAGTLAQAVASVALGYAQATTQAAKMGPWAWVAFAATGLAQMISTISTIKSVAHYAEGGIVGGNSYSGDNVGPVLLDAGELILNRSQQSNIASQLQEGNAASVSSTPFVSGELIYLGLSNYLRRTGRGELLTAKG